MSGITDVLYFFVICFYQFRRSGTIGNDGHSETFHVHVTGNDDFGNSGHSDGISADDPDPIVFCRRFERRSL